MDMVDLPSGYVNSLLLSHGPVESLRVFPLKKVMIFHSYVELLEGIVQFDMSTH